MNSSIDQQFIEFVVKSLVNNPDDVSIERTIDEKGVLLELTVNPEDLGRVIGKRGATAQSLRTLLRALGTKNDARYNLKIVDNGEPRPPRDDYRQTDTSTDNSSPSNNDQNDNSGILDSNDSVGTFDSSPNENDIDTVSNEEVSTTDENNTKNDASSDHSDAVRKTRAELAELDDLDI